MDIGLTIHRHSPVRYNPVTMILGRLEPYPPGHAAPGRHHPESPVFTTAIATANSSDIPAQGTVTFARLIGDLVARFVNIPPDTVDELLRAADQNMQTKRLSTPR